MGGAQVLAVEQAQSNQKKQQSTLGGAFKLRKLPGAEQAPVTAPIPTAAATGPLLSSEVLNKFERAYENVGIFEHKVTSTSAHTVHCELTADSEEKVFNAISATAFLAVRDAGVPGVKLDMVELFMKTTMGGSSGRFQMTREDALALDNKQISKEDYFVRKVIY